MIKLFFLGILLLLIPAAFADRYRHYDNDDRDFNRHMDYRYGRTYTVISYDYDRYDYDDFDRYDYRYNNYNRYDYGNSLFNHDTRQYIYRTINENYQGDIERIEKDYRSGRQVWKVTVNDRGIRRIVYL